MGVDRMKMTSRLTLRQKNSYRLDAIDIFEYLTHVLTNHEVEIVFRQHDIHYTTDKRAFIIHWEGDGGSVHNDTYPFSEINTVKKLRDFLGY